MPKRSEDTSELPQPRWAHGVESQAPDKVKQGRTVGENEPWGVTKKFVSGGVVAEQDRNTTAVGRTLHIDIRIADEPHRGARPGAARLKREEDRRGIGLVDRCVACPDDAAEQP